MNLDSAPHSLIFEATEILRDSEKKIHLCQVNQGEGVGGLLQIKAYISWESCLVRYHQYITTPTLSSHTHLPYVKDTGQDGDAVDNACPFLHGTLHVFVVCLWSRMEGNKHCHHDNLSRDYEEKVNRD